MNTIIRTSLFFVFCVYFLFACKEEADAKASGVPASTALPVVPLLYCPTTYNEAKDAQEKTASALGLPKRLEIMLGGDVSLPFVLVPPGRFVFQGKRAEQVDRPFYIAETELTRAQYSAWKEPPAADVLPNGLNAPVGIRSYDEGQQLLRHLSERFGLSIRLPTEVEWEYACRAGTAGCYGEVGVKRPGLGHFGSWNELENGYRRADRVLFNVVEPRLYPANSWGIYDALGNMEEMCSPAHSNEPGSSLFVPTRGGNIIYCGGYFESVGQERATLRNYVGVRPVLDISDGLMTQYRSNPVSH